METAEPAGKRPSRNPVDRLTSGLPRPARIAIDWIVTIAGAILIVLAIKAWVVNPYRIPSSSMEPTLHCARSSSPEGRGCIARFSDRVLACRFCYRLHSPHRGDIVVFNTPPAAQAGCNAGGVFVKRLIGEPNDVVSYNGTTLRINGKVVEESYLRPSREGGQTGVWHVPKGQYFM